MGDPKRRVLGQVRDIDGNDLIIGVDYDTVIIRWPGSGAAWRLDKDAIEEFARLIVAATWEASRNG